MLNKGAGIREIERTLKGRGEKASKDTIRKVKSTAEDLALLKRAKTDKKKLKSFLEPTYLANTNYKDIYELHKGFNNCEMTLTELKREYEIHKIEFIKMTKKGAEETWAIREVIRFFDGWEGIGGYGKREEEVSRFEGKSKSEWDEYDIKRLEFSIRQDEETMKLPPYKHLHENR